MTWISAVVTEQAQLDWAFVWTVAAAVSGFLALIGVAYGVAGYYRDHPKRQLEYTVRSSRLILTAPSPRLEVKIDGIAVRDPYIVDFRMVANSRADISSSAFDGGRSLSVRVEPGGALILGDRRDQGIIATDGESDGWAWAQFDIAPQLIRKKSELQLVFIANGSPKVEVSSPLIDVPVVDVTRRPDRGDVASAWFVLGTSIFVLVGTIIAPYTNPESETPAWLHWGMLVVFAAMTAGSVALVRSQLWWQKARD